MFSNDFHNVNWGRFIKSSGGLVGLVSAIACIPVIGFSCDWIIGKLLVIPNTINPTETLPLHNLTIQPV